MRRAFEEFLLVPACLIAGFLVLAALMYWLDRSPAGWLEPGRRLLVARVFSESKATADLLGTVAGALITVTSLTVTLLLIALQQAASALTHQIYDQFLRRRYNQVYFGFFVGLSLYTLVTLATVGPVNPVYSAALTLVLTLAALCLLIVMFYSTIDQMRPAAIISAIHDHVLVARSRQLRWMRATRSRAQCEAPLRVPIVSAGTGFVTAIDLEVLGATVKRAQREVEVELRVSMGAFAAYGDVLAEVRAYSREDATAVRRALEKALVLSRDRNLAADPLDGVEEMHTIAWTTISSAQSDPDPALIAIRALRDLLSRWAGETAEQNGNLPVVYGDDVMPGLMDALESLAVSASESMQHQTYAEILATFNVLYGRLPPRLQDRAEEVVLTSLSGLGEHILTAGLRRALVDTVAVFERHGRRQPADAVKTALEHLATSLGRLGSRATRAA